MRSIPAILALLVFLLFPAKPALFAQASTDPAPRQIIAQSQEALDQGDSKTAQRLVQEGLQRFPGDESLEVQLARVYIYQKLDTEATGLLNSVLRSNPGSRDARLELAHLYGYHQEYTASDRIYRELLAANPDDESASLGLIHNLILEGRRSEARQRLQEALQRHPASLELQQYSDYLAANPKRETRQQYFHRVQGTESYFSDSSGNHAVYSSQGFACEFTQKFITRSFLEETSLWKPGADKLTVAAGGTEAQLRLNNLATIRGGTGAVKFADGETRPLYSGDLDLHPWKNLLVSGGYFRSYVAPTVDAASFNILSQGWRARVDYRTQNFSLTGNIFLRHLSDGNHAEREYAEALRWFGFGSFSLGAGYAFRHLHFAEDLNHGYFSPLQYRSHLGAAGLRFRIGRIFRAEYLGYGGREILEGLGGYTPAGEVLLKNDFLLGRWTVAVDYSHFHLLQTTGAFRADSATVNLGYRF